MTGFSKKDHDRLCNKCKWALLADDGYSNYTVEGTTLYCLMNKHPDGHFDKFYGQDDRLEYALKCDFFIAGEPVQVDVDKDLLDRKHFGYGYTTDFTVAPLVRRWFDESGK